MTTPLTATPRTDDGLLSVALACEHCTESVHLYGADMKGHGADIRRVLAELAAAKAERDLAITRVASILWSGAIDKHTCGDVQKWAADYTAELVRLRAENQVLAIRANLRLSALDYEKLNVEAFKARAERAEEQLALKNSQ